MFSAKKILVSTIIVCLGTSMFTVALAQEPAAEPLGKAEVSVEVAEAVDLDENIQAKDLGIEEPKVLPGSFFYSFKNIARGLRSAFTFNPFKKADLKLRFVNERLIEAKKLAEIQPEETKTLGKALENYQKETARLKKAGQKLAQKAADPRTNDFIDKLVDNNLKHQKLLGKFEKELAPEIHEKIEAAKEEGVAGLSEIGLKITSPEVFAKKITEIAETRPGSKFKHFKNLEILKGIEVKVPQTAKKAIRQAKENSLKRLHSDLAEMSEGDRKKFKDYVENIGGNEMRHLSIMDEFEREEMPEIIREQTEKAKEKIFERVEKRLEKYEEMDLDKSARAFLAHLKEEGRLEDLRVIKDLENNLRGPVIDILLPLKREVEKKVIEVIARAEMPDQQKEFFERIEKKFHDVRQMEVFQEIEEIIPAEQKEFFEKMKERATDKMKQEIERAETLNWEERAMIIDKLAGDSPEHIKVFEEFGPPPEIMPGIMKETVERLSRRAEFIEDPERLEIFKRKIEEEAEIRRVIEKNQPEMFKKIEEKRVGFMEMLGPERAKKQMEEAEVSISLCQDMFATLVPELQSEVLEKSSYQPLLEAAKKHLGGAEKALIEQDFGESFGQATAALHNAANCHRTIDEIQMRRSFEEDRQKKFETRFEEIREKLEEEMPEAIPAARPRRPDEFIPDKEKIAQCPLPHIPTIKCLGRWEMKKDERGCAYFFCEKYEEEIHCAKEGEKVNRNPLLGPSTQRCCPGLEEIRISKSWSICKKEIRREEGIKECEEDFDCPQPLCLGAGPSKCVEGRCIIAMCKQIKPLPPEPVKPRPIPEKPGEPEPPEIKDETKPVEEEVWPKKIPETIKKFIPPRIQQIEVEAVPVTP